MDYLAAAQKFATEWLANLEFLEGREIKVVPLDTLGANDSIEGEISFNHNGCTVTITVGDFWDHPDDANYFVNVSHPNGNFMNCPGTNRPMVAMFNLGTCIEFANHVESRW